MEGSQEVPAVFAVTGLVQKGDAVDFPAAIDLPLAFACRETQKLAGLRLSTLLMLLCASRGRCGRRLYSRLQLAARMEQLQLLPARLLQLQQQPLSSLRHVVSSRPMEQQPGCSPCLQPQCTASCACHPSHRATPTAQHPSGLQLQTQQLLQARLRSHGLWPRQQRCAVRLLRQLEMRQPRQRPQSSLWAAAGRSSCQYCGPHCLQHSLGGMAQTGSCG